MSQTHISMRDSTVNGDRSECWKLEVRGMLGFESHAIARIGLDSAFPPYERVRVFPQGSFLMVCMRGSGQILLEGSWQRIGAGEVCMAPPRVLNAFRADRNKVWRIAWIRCEEALGVRPMVGAASPLRMQGGADLADGIAGFQREWLSDASPALLHCWAQLIAASAQRLARPFQGEKRLQGLWQRVAEALGEPWPLKRLAEVACMSAEHLRRVCFAEMGRTPMQQVTSMRVKAAFPKLERQGEKLETVAQELGYADAFVFSKVFKRITGVSPMEYRAKL